MDETVKRARRARAAQRSREHGYRAGRALRSVGKLPPSLGGPVTGREPLGQVTKVSSEGTVWVTLDGKVLPT